MSLVNAPGDKRMRMVIEIGVNWKPTIVRCEERPARIESQLDVRGDNFLGQFVSAECAFVSSMAGVKTPLDRKS